MERHLHPLERDLEALSAAWADSLPAFGADEGSAQAEVEQMSDAGLVAVTDLIAQVRRDADALLTRVAAEVAKRSGREFGESGLARAQGFHNPVRLIAASTRSSRSDAAKLIAVGTATAERRTFSGERAPSRHPHVAAALDTAEIGVEAASAIMSMLDRVAVRADPARAEITEAALVGLASQVSLEILLRGVREAEARLDQDGIEHREEELRHERSLTMREDGNGMVHLHARLDPESAAPVKVAIEALVSDVLRRRERTPGEVGPVLDDSRSIPQIQADALAAIARHALGCTHTLTPLAKTTVVVRMNLDTLIDGIGHARIDGIVQPISAGTARRMAADAELIPAVFGGDSLPLDLGRAARFFSRVQRLALTERDGGCASCGAEHRLRRGTSHRLVAPRHRHDRPREPESCSAASATTWCIAKHGASGRPQARSGSFRRRTSITSGCRDSEEGHDSNPNWPRRREIARRGSTAAGLGRAGARR